MNQLLKPTFSLVSLLGGVLVVMAHVCLSLSHTQLSLSLSICVCVYLQSLSYTCLLVASPVFILLGDCVCKTCYRQLHVPSVDLKRACSCGDSKVEGVCKMCFLSSEVLHPSGGGFVFGHKIESFTTAE
jgi:hypothetical protein